MKNNQKLSVMFWIKRSKTTRDGQAPLYVRITIDAQDEEIALGRKCDPAFWDTDLKRVTAQTSEAKTTNLRIAEIQMNLEKGFIVLQSQYDKVTPLMLKNFYNRLPVFNKKNERSHNEITATPKTLLQAFSDFITKFQKQVDKGQRSFETLKHWRTTQKKVKEFLAFQYSKEDIGLREVRYSFAEKCYTYLTLECKTPVSEISAKGHIKKLKQILQGCEVNEDIDKNPLQAFRCSGGEKDVDPLEMEQVQRIYHKEFTVTRLAEVRDAFIFQCFTGFAYQDVYALSRENIVKVGNKGERWLVKDRNKTKVSEIVPILPIVDEIIEKYKNHPYCISHNCLLPVNSNARYNAYLKEIADICGVTSSNPDDRGLNTHKARHTFADIMLNCGVPLEDVSKMLGHKSIRTTERYCKVRKNRISLNMAKARSVLFTETGKLRRVS